MINKNINEKIKDLEKLSYFRYASLDDIHDLKITLSRSIEAYGELTSIFDEEDNFMPKCFRYYMCDLKEVEADGGMDLLDNFQLLFEKLNVPLIHSNLEDEYDEDQDCHTWEIKLNNTSYQLTRKSRSDFAKEFANMINQQLIEYKSEEKLYLITPGNSGGMIFLNRNLKEYFDSNIQLRELFTPMEPNKWYLKYGDGR